MSATRKIRWSPKVPQAPVARLYERDSEGIHDDELLVEVGYALWARAADVALVARAAMRCPVDGTEFAFSDAVSWRLPARSKTACPSCDWQITIEQWRQSISKQDLNGSVPFVNEYVAKWPAARTYRDRMLLVDRLLHEVHASGGNLVRTLIEGGRHNSPHAFLDRLAYGSASTVDQDAREVFAKTGLNRSRRSGRAARQ
jgi:hypothetical protein